MGLSMGWRRAGLCLPGAAVRVTRTDDSRRCHSAEIISTSRALSGDQAGAPCPAAPPGSGAARRASRTRRLEWVLTVFSLTMDPRGDLLVAQPRGDQLEDLELARRDAQRLSLSWSRTKSAGAGTGLRARPRSRLFRVSLGRARCPAPRTARPRSRRRSPPMLHHQPAVLDQLQPGDQHAAEQAVEQDVLAHRRRRVGRIAASLAACRADAGARPVSAAPRSLRRGTPPAAPRA